MGHFWIGTSKGLASWKDGKLTQYAELAGLYIYRLLEDHERTIWAGAGAIPSGRLCAIQNASVKCYGEDGTIGRAVFGLYEDSKGNLWVGVIKRAVAMETGSSEILSRVRPAGRCSGFGEGGDGALLIGTARGIRRFVDGTIEPYRFQAMCRSFDARRVLRDRDGGLWIGTVRRGLVHVHKGGTDVFSVSDGLSGDDVFSLFEDREGSIWVGTIMASTAFATSPSKRLP